MSKTLSTCGDLREFLANMALGVKNEEIDVKRAMVVIKAAEKINENYYAEIKVARMQIETGKAAAALGALPINKE